MKQTIDFYDFERAFVDYGRSDHFSYDAKKAIFEYLESLEEDTGEEIELDVVGVCCDFSESSLEEINSDNGESFETLDDAAEWLERQTSVIATLDDTIVYQSF